MNIDPRHATPLRVPPDRELRFIVGGLVTILALVGFIAVALTAQRGVPLRSYYTVRAEFRSVGNIEQYSEVRIAGQLVGQVLDSSYRHGIASLQLQLQKSSEPLRGSTTAQIRLKGLLGAKYVELVPGRTGVSIPNGGTIPASRTSTAVDVFHVLQTLDARRRLDLRQTLAALGGGFLGRGAQLNDALAAAVPVLSSTDAYASAVNTRTGAAARLIPAAQSLSAALDPVRVPLAAGFAPQARLLTPFVAERSPTESALEIAPGALSTTRTGLAATDPLLAQTTGFARAAVQLTGVAPSALRQATALLQSTPGPLRQLTPLADALGGAVDPTVRLTGGVAPLITPAIRALTDSVPTLAALGTHACDVLAFARNWRSLLGYGQASSTGDPIGPSDYVMTGVAANADALSPSAAKPPALIGHDPYPAACTAPTEHLR